MVIDLCERIELGRLRQHSVETNFSFGRDEVEITLNCKSVISLVHTMLLFMDDRIKSIKIPPKLLHTNIKIKDGS